MCFIFLGNMSHARLDNNVDVVIIGAGVSGLSAAYKLTQKNAGLDVIILEAKGKLNNLCHISSYIGAFGCIL